MDLEAIRPLLSCGFVVLPNLVGHGAFSFKFQPLQEQMQEQTPGQSHLNMPWYRLLKPTTILKMVAISITVIVVIS
jgi:hypothetical protein